MVTTLYLIRHGETEGSERASYKGSIDVPLSENGIRQMLETSCLLKELLGKSSSLKQSYLQDIHGSGVSATDSVAAVYCSSLARAIKSAEIIAGPYGLEPVKIHGLRERSFGIWEGMTFSEIKEKYPEEFGLWAGNPLRYSPVGGESTMEVRERVIGALKRILYEHGGEKVAVVAHVLEIPLEHLFRVEQDHAAINIIEFWEKYPVVKLMNGKACNKSDRQHQV
jgi:broad specificity phosphatase PhoE